MDEKALNCSLLSYVTFAWEPMPRPRAMSDYEYECDVKVIRWFKNITRNGVNPSSTPDHSTLDARERVRETAQLAQPVVWVPNPWCRTS